MTTKQLKMWWIENGSMLWGQGKSNGGHKQVEGRGTVEGYWRVLCSGES